ncbi:hypothetical protein CDAR_366591 [Caerostris darwini]|uniref:Uncharacterized protein n=1 Tax=Caerostris darwini TaxID=1538125 RepID=A0AAV4Q8P5_9ARAC|nr:hypothetical protein CDAR_366591 [Caerostris darwini]
MMRTTICLLNRYPTLGMSLHHKYRLPPERGHTMGPIKGILLHRTPNPTKFSRINPAVLQFKQMPGSSERDTHTSVPLNGTRCHPMVWHLFEDGSAPNHWDIVMED